MSNYDDNIPMLTDILQIGDADMHHHFDAHQFEDEDNAESAQSINFENASSLENTTSDNTSDDTPVLQMYMDDETPLEEELPDEDFSESMQPCVKELETNLHGNKVATLDTISDSLSQLEIKEAIDQAIQESLPQIEESLKQMLYKKLGL